MNFKHVLLDHKCVHPDIKEDMMSLPEAVGFRYIESNINTYAGEMSKE